MGADAMSDFLERLGRAAADAETHAIRKKEWLSRDDTRRYKQIGRFIAERVLEVATLAEHIRGQEAIDAGMCPTEYGTVQDCPLQKTDSEVDNDGGPAEADGGKRPLPLDTDPG